MTQSIKNLIRRLNPGISAEQKRFEIIEDLGGEGIVTQVLEQTADKPLPGFLQAAAESTLPVDLLQGNVINTTSLSGQHLR